MTSKIQKKEVREKIETLFIEGTEQDLAEEICEIIFGKENNQAQKIDTIVSKGIEKKYGRKVPMKIKDCLFTRLDAIEEGLSEEEARIREAKDQTFAIFSDVIDGEFTIYYRYVEKIIRDSRLFIREDLRYILLHALFLKDEGIYKIKGETLLEWKETYEFLSIPPKEEAKKKNKNIKKCLNGVKGILANKTSFPIHFNNSINYEKELLYIGDVDVEYQIALLFYNDFRNRFIYRNRHKTNINDTIIIQENIDNLMSICADNINKFDYNLSLYLMEMWMGINLCIEYGTYYDAVLSCDECQNKPGKNKIVDYLLKIFKHFCEMPNVIARGRIMYEFMQPVIVTNQLIEKQLVIIEKQIYRLKENYCEIAKCLEEIIKKVDISQKIMKLHQYNLKEKMERFGELWYVKNMIEYKDISLDKNMLFSNVDKILRCRIDQCELLQKNMDKGREDDKDFGNAKCLQDFVDVSGDWNRTILRDIKVISCEKDKCELLQKYQDNLKEGIERFNGVEYIENILDFERRKFESSSMLVLKNIKKPYCAMDSFKLLQKEYIKNIKNSSYHI